MKSDIELTYWKKHILKKYLPIFENRFINFEKKNDFVLSETLITFLPKEFLCNCKESNKDLTDLVFAWGNKKVSSQLSSCKKIIRIEDGFIRSNGLGCKFHYPYSWVFDPIGIYFDPKKPSLLECMLCTIPKFRTSETNINAHEQYKKLIKNAKELQSYIIKNNITKYTQDNQRKNAITEIESEYGKRTFLIEGKDYSVSQDTKIILVPGQVDDDASILTGGLGYTSLSLLREVKKNNPNAFIIYKIHPDVLSGLRDGERNIEILSKLSNCICSDNVSIVELINFADEIHTITSLVGFDALIRGKKVFTYGMPFYASWGLTVDKQNCPRRNIKLSIEELIAITLIEYPFYYDWDQDTPSTALEICKRLTNKKSKQHRPLYLMSFVFRILKKIGVCK